jgi:hypothetical protein
MTASRRSIELNIFGEHVRGFEAPHADEAATVLRNSEDLSRWTEFDLSSIVIDCRFELSPLQPIAQIVNVITGYNDNLARVDNIAEPL